MANCAGWSPLQRGLFMMGAGGSSGLFPEDALPGRSSKMKVSAQHTC